MNEKNGSEHLQRHDTSGRHPNLRKFSPLFLITFIAAALFLVFAPTTTRSLSRQQSPTFKCPTYIDAWFPGGGNANGPGRREPDDPYVNNMQDAHDVLASCDTITSLKLYNDDTGCEAPGLDSLPFSIPLCTRYPSQIKELDLVLYNFNDNDWTRLERLRPKFFTSSLTETLRGYYDWVRRGYAVPWLTRLLQQQTHLTNLDLWLKSMDFSHIETFSFRPKYDSYVPNATVLASHLPSLKSFTAYGPWAKEFILARPENSLTHLAWIHSGQTGASVLPVLQHHAESLTSLDWHEPESVYRERRVMTADQIATLGSILPNLRSITLDIKQQNGTWSRDHLEALATNFPNLENATIFYEMASDCRRQLNPSFDAVFGRRNHEEMKARETELNCVGDNSKAQPSLGIYNAPVPFEFLVKTNAGGKLKKVVFYSGGWDMRDEGGMFYFDWVDEHRSWAVCRVIRHESGLADDISTPAVFDEGDWVIDCQNALKRRFKTVSEVRSRRTAFHETTFDKADYDRGLRD